MSWSRRQLIRLLRIVCASLLVMSVGCMEHPDVHEAEEALDVDAGLEDKALPGSFKIRNEATGLCMRRSGSIKVGSGFEVYQASCDDEVEGLWWRRQCTGTTCQYISGSSTAYCLKASASLKASGGSYNVYAVQCASGIDEKWSVSDIGSGRLQLKSQRTGSCAYASQSEKTSAGAFQIVQRACGTEPKFLFKQVPAATTDPGGVLKIISFSVGSADSALIVFPTGKTMMVDSATPSRFADRVLPFLQRHGVKRLDYYSESHPHPDHVGGNALLRSKGYIDAQTKVWDWKSHEYEDTFTLEGTKWFIYNVRDTAFHGTDANDNSLAFRMEYNGFVYTSGGDEGLGSMNRFLKEHPDLVRAHVRKMEHHLWGPVSPSFIKATDPALMIISSISDVREESVFRRDFLGAVNYLKTNGKRLKEYVITEEVGNVIVRASSGSNWSYDFCSNINSCIVPNFP